MPIQGLTIIEIGPGPGGLTKVILDNSPKELILIEKDKIIQNSKQHPLDVGGSIYAALDSLSIVRGEKNIKHC